MHDEARVGVNAQPVHPAASPAGWEWIGDPAKNEGPVRARFRLTAVTLERQSGAAWSTVARAPATAGVPALYGSWAPVPQLPSGTAAPGTAGPLANTKLWLWSKSAFDYTRATGGAWDESFAAAHPGYPCVPAPPPRHICCDVQDMPVGTVLKSPWRCAEQPGITVEWPRDVRAVVTALAEPVDGLTRAICFPADGEVDVTTPDGAHAVTVTTRPQDSGGTRRCVAFEGKPPRAHTWSGLAIRVLDGTGRAVALSVVTIAGTPGLDCDHAAQITLPRETGAVDLELSALASPVTIEARDRTGRVVDRLVIKRSRANVRVPLRGAGIARVTIEAPHNETALHRLCYEEPALEIVPGDAKAKVTAGDGRVRVTEPGGKPVKLVAHDGVCIVRVCLDLEPDPAAVTAHREMNEHMRGELQRWADTGAVLDPDTVYRLRVDTAVDTDGDLGAATAPQTEYAYFRTDGPPGLAALSIPRGATSEYESGLDDLTRYVAQTIPPTVPAAGERPLLPRPVYRAYDVSVRFDEDYVDLMYRRAHRDLALQLFDPNDEPLRDAAGKLIIPTDQWTGAPDATLSAADLRWIEAIDTGSCATLDTTVIPADRALAAATGTVLAPDAVYEARLIPLLMRDGFAEALGARWTADDRSGTSVWQARFHPELTGAAATVAGNVVTLDGTADLSVLEPALDQIELAGDTARTTRRFASPRWTPPRGGSPWMARLYWARPRARGRSRRPGRWCRAPARPARCSPATPDGPTHA